MADTARMGLVSARDVLNTLFRHKWKMTGFFGVVLVSALVWTFLIVPKMYESEAKLLVRLGRENLAMDPSVSGPTVSLLRDRESEINSEVSIFTNRDLAEQLVQALGEDTFLEPGEKKTGWRLALQQCGKFCKRTAKSALAGVGLIEPLTPYEEAVLEVMDNLDVQAERRANIVNVKFDAETPDLAHDALARIIQGYLDRHIEAYATQASPQFFEEQSEKLRTVLAEKERQLNDYKTQNQIAQLDQQKQVLLQQVSDTEKQAGDASAQINGSEARVAALQKSLQGHNRTHELSRTTGRTNSAADGLKTRLADLKLKESDISSRYPDTHQPLIDLRQQIKEIGKELSKEEETHTEVTTGVDANFQELELNLQMEQAQLQSNAAKKQAMDAELSRLRDSVAQLTAREYEYTAMKRDVDLAEQEYRQYRDNLQRSRISAELDRDKVSNISVVQAATLPIEPVKPRKALNLGLGLLIAVLGAMALAFLAEYLDDTLKSGEEVERRLGVPILVEITEKENRACI